MSAQGMIEIRYFAVLKEFANCAHEQFALTSEKTYADLYQSLAKRHHFPLSLDQIQVAVNDEFADLNAAIQPGVNVVFIPPVAGG